MRGEELTRLGATGLPLGQFCESEFEVVRSHLEPGDSVFLYADGLSEATNADGEPFGTERVEAIVRAENCHLYDARGKRYVDLEAGVWCTALGHANPRVLRTIGE